MKKQLFCLLLIILGISACQEGDYYPPGLYGYQVERLLTEGDTAVWDLVSLYVDGSLTEMNDCSDSLRLQFVQTSDTLVVYQYSSCATSGTLYLGNMTASSSTNSESNEYVFTDSLLFEGGAWDYLIVRDITATSFRFLRPVSAEQWVYYFEKSVE